MNSNFFYCGGDDDKSVSICKYHILVCFLLCFFFFKCRFYRFFCRFISSSETLVRFSESMCLLPLLLLLIFFFYLVRFDTESSHLEKKKKTVFIYIQLFGRQMKNSVLQSFSVDIRLLPPSRNTHKI